ncbi:MAG: sigma-70 family RNA polymerase sigma factor [Verrucomicrobiaceae bacterium]|nr:sigma-70 family RNA polymerase sigma factor [Verrucomicrobiaceae bacterium]
MHVTTRFTLIEALRNGGGASAWERFYNTYSSVVISFARRQGCDEHAALDVLQETMMVILRKLPDFQYDRERGRFRNWLMTIASNKVREARRRAKVDRLVSLDAPQEGTHPSLADQLSAETESASDNLERDWRSTLLETALRKILEDPRTNSVSITIFRQVALENIEPSEVARLHGMKENNVYQIKNRIMTRLKAIIAELETGAVSEDC